MQYKCKAIVLKTTKLGESDKILNLYCPEKGSLRAIAKGSRKSNSSFGSKAQVLNYCDFLIGKGRNLDVISQAKLIEDFSMIRTNYDSLTFACFMVDVVDSITAQEDICGDYFELLYSSLLALDSVEERKDYLCVVLTFLWGLINQMGYKPELNRCCLTGLVKPSNQTAKYFNLKDGGIVSTQAYMDYEKNNPYQSEIYAISSSAYKILQSLDFNKDSERLSKEKLSELMSDPSINSLLEEIINEEVEIKNLSEGENITKQILAARDNLKEFESTGLQDSIKLLHKHLEYRMHREFKSWKLLEPCLN